MSSSDLALERRRVAGDNLHVDGPGFGDDGMNGADGLAHLQGVVLRHLADQVSGAAGVDAAVGGSQNGEFDRGLSVAVVNGLVDVLAVLEPENVWLGAAERLARNLESVADGLDVEQRRRSRLVRHDRRGHLHVPGLGQSFR